MAAINHGTVRGYKAGCRCDLCTHANTKAKQRERERQRERDGKPPTPRKPTRRVPTRPKTDLQEGEPGPIEACFREALNSETDSALVRARREVVFAAARVMDNPKAVAFFKSAADVMRSTVADLLASEPAKDGEADALNALVASFGPRGRSRGGSPVDDAPEPGPGDDRT